MLTTQADAFSCLSCKRLKRNHPSPGILRMFWMLFTLIGTLCRADSSSDEIVCLLKGADPKDHRIPFVGHCNVIEVPMTPIRALRNLDSKNQSITKGQLPNGARAFAPPPPLIDQLVELLCAKDVVISCSCIGSPSLDVIECTPLPAKAALQILHSCLGVLAHCLCCAWGKIWASSLFLLAESPAELRAESRTVAIRMLQAYVPTDNALSRF